MRNGDIMDIMTQEEIRSATQLSQYISQIEKEKGETFELLEKSGAKAHEKITGVPNIVLPERVQLDPSVKKIEQAKRLINFIGNFRYNIITGKIEYSLNGVTFHPFTDRIFNSLRSQLIKYVNISEADLRMIFNSEFVPTFDPIKLYFNSLPSWDGTTDYVLELATLAKITPGQFGYNIDAQQEFYKALRKWLIASTATMLQRGQNQYCVVLLGSQGIGKTTYCRRLGILPEFVYVGALTSDKDSLIYIAEKTLIVLDELESTTKSEFTQLKSQMTLDQVTVRRPYARTSEVLPRRASFCASANDPHVLSDLTGSRRFLCFEVTAIDYKTVTPELMKKVYSQCLSLLNSGEKFWLDLQEISSLEARNSRFYAACPEEEILTQVLYLPSDPAFQIYQKQVLTNTEILNIISEKFPLVRFSGKKLGQVLKKQGFERISRSSDRLYGYEIVLKS